MISRTSNIPSHEPEAAQEDIVDEIGGSCLMIRGLLDISLYDLPGSISSKSALVLHAAMRYLDDIEAQNARLGSYLDKLDAYEKAAAG
jgi:hypothetical protein